MSDDESAAADAAMREMMGFGAFVSATKNKHVGPAPPTTVANSSQLNEDNPRRKKARFDTNPTSTSIHSSDTPNSASAETLPSQHVMNVSAMSFLPASLPPRPLRPSDQSVDVPAPTQHQDQSSFTQPPTSDTPAYTNPNTGISFTGAGLRELAQGKRNANEFGDTVYFKPRFLEPDPWGHVRELQSLGRAKGRAT